MSLLLAIAAAAAYAIGSVTQAAAARRSGSLGALAGSPVYLAGLATDALAFVLSLLALRGLPIWPGRSRSPFCSRRWPCVRGPGGGIWWRSG